MTPEEKLEGLAGALRAADPNAFLVPLRIIRRVILEDRPLPGFTLKVPHRKTYVIPGRDALAVVDRSELGLSPRAPAPETVILIAAPNPDQLEEPSGLLRTKIWRLLFHARIHAALQAKIAAGGLSRPAIRSRIDRIGQTSFDEIRAVLRQEDLILPPKNDRGFFVEFAAFFLELLHFAPRLLPHTFPSISDPGAVERLLAEDLPVSDLLAETRLPGATDPTRERESTEADGPPATDVEPPSPRRRRSLSRRATRARRRGNDVRAAILSLRAGAADKAEERLDRLTARLSDALDLGEEDAEAWRPELSELLLRSRRGLRTPEAKILYDLQKVCVDHERGVFTVDVTEWLLTFGKRPVTRSLPSEREVLMTRHLRKAKLRLQSTRLPASERSRITRLLRQAEAQAEERLRDLFRPRLRETLLEVGMRPGNLPERVAFAKLTEELLDRVVEHGRIRLSDLRDAISRNQLKLPDFRGVGDLFGGDLLLRADRQLALSLDGVYRRGELYLRWLQSLSALILGTKIGRFLTRHAILPFGGAFVALEGLQHIVGPVVRWISGAELHFISYASIALSGAFLWGLIHVPAFRDRVGDWLGLAGRGLRALFVTLPSFLLRLPPVRAVLESRPFLLLFRFGIKPVLYTVAIWGVLRVFGVVLPRAWTDAVGVFLGMNAIVNSPWGRLTEELGTEWLGRTAHRLRARVLAGILRFLISFFRAVLQTVDHLLYTVDEWLRFRTGESRVTIAVKAILGAVWFFVSYVVRLYTNLLIEPQVNPVKHFPVVTVSHKIILPMSVTLTGVLATPLLPLGAVAANAIAGTTVLLLPGVFGFLVWELKENWRLFAANRPRDVRPVTVGSHGETMRRLLRPGFHSGTLPKLFARHRRAERKAKGRPVGKRRRKIRAALHHVRVDIRRFARRELLAHLVEGGVLPEAAPQVGEVRMGSNIVGIELRCEALTGASLGLRFEEQGGRLVASVAEPGWVAALPEDRRNRFRNALAGFYKAASVDLVREQIRADLGAPAPAYDIDERGIVVWPGEGYEEEVVHDVDDFLFSKIPLPWADWVAAWEPADGTDPPRPLLPEVELLRP